jgi:hypothetical protein
MTDDLRARLEQLVKEWRARAHRNGKSPYRKAGLAQFQCADELEAAIPAIKAINRQNKDLRAWIAATRADWQQVVLNGGPPCFHYESERERFCLSAERWRGHGVFHEFVPLDSLLRAAAEAVPQEQTGQTELQGPAGGARGEADARERDAGTPQSTGTSAPLPPQERGQEPSAEVDCTACDDTGIMAWKEAYCRCHRGTALARSDGASAEAVVPREDREACQHTRGGKHRPNIHGESVCGGCGVKIETRCTYLAVRL